METIRRIKKLAIFVSLILALVAGCGKKAPPVPWGTVVPKRIVDLEATVREGRVLLEWTAPKENANKSPLVDLAGFRILRSEGILVAGECRGCGEKKEVVHELKMGPKEETTGKRIFIFLEDHEPQKVYVYEVVSVNRRGYLGSPSNPVWVYWDHPPRSPGEITAKPGDRRVDLHWEPVHDATGYNIYRRLEGEEFPLLPLNREPLTETRYADLNVENERRYIYSVRAVRRIVKTDVEGTGSPERVGVPTDLVAPNSPSGLIAIPLKSGMELTWKRNAESDFLGYFVYRRRVREKEFKRLHEAPLEKEIYLDAAVEIGEDYEYALTAVDNSPQRNESPRSEAVRVRYMY